MDLTVLDLSRVLTGPFAAMILGDLGARVIKVERPGAGDETRQWGPPFVGTGRARTSSYFLAVNRNKESIALDFADDSDRSVLLRLIERSDVLIENFRPGVLDRLGLSHETIQQANPRIVIVSITGFGPDGPMARRAGYDQIIQGEAGLMSITGPGPGEPMKAGIPIADLSAGMFGVIGALSALHDRGHSGRGRVVHTSLLASIVGLHTFQATRWLIGGEVPIATGNRHPTVAPYGAFACRDGRLMQIAIGNETLWRRLAKEVGVDPDDPRFCSNEQRRLNEHALDELLSAAIATKDLHEWGPILDAAGIPNGTIKSLDEVYRDPQVYAQGLVAELWDPELGVIRLPGSAIRLDGETLPPYAAPPRLDEHGARLRTWVSADLQQDHRSSEREHRPGGA